MKKHEQREVARTSLLLRSLPDDISDGMLDAAHRMEAGRGDTLFLQGEPASAIHIVLEGWVKLYRISPNGSEAVVSVFTRGESFGEAAALRALPYPVSAEAVTDCQLLRIPAGALVSVMKERPEICLSILGSTFQHLHSLVNQLEQIKGQTGAQRVAEFLLELSDRKAGGCTVTLPYDKMLIAGRLGMKPESLSRTFSKLRALGVRIAGNCAVIEDVARLRDYTEEDPAAAWNKGP
ncbi:Crp/Fnr family transcriptional regulator [Actibacterium sp. MT2.3-13A]|uniref:Crp/Fnr family transcriptional regulator n=1 Tax=Actibacterium sp. MT2.3-13A TaxID=2828332 RepID=UPI001BA50352|nr:Crp/Fnr family transcriptional regulator [Actibacterium sp. MT2.3-13A]